MRKYAVTLIIAVIIVGGALINWASNKDTAKEEAVVKNPPALSQQNSAGTDDSAAGTPSVVDPADSTDTPSDQPNANEAVPNEADASKDNSDASDQGSTKSPDEDKPVTKPAENNPESSSTSGSTVQSSGSSSSNTSGKSGYINSYSVEHVVANPTSQTVLVNKTYRLPDGYVPPDLVYPDVPFTFSDKVDKRKMRREAAAALKNLFAGAKSDGVLLAGVSGYRSESRQTTLYNNYVKRDGVKAADTYSARPGHSEHQTGLTIDVSGSTGKCAAESCFAGTKEAKWLGKHASEYGFIIRYPEGKQSITGYKYEPWHLRYVGKDIAAEVTKRSITLEQYFGKDVPVTK